MREIKFRGKTEKNGNWVQGFYAKQGDIVMIMSDLVVSGDYNPAKISFDFYRVIPETVGQFTGLLDKNGLTYIYEGDIIDTTGLVRGNIHESSQDFRFGIDIIVTEMGTKTWRGTEQRLLGCGCEYAL